MKKNITDIVLIVMVIIWIASNGLLHARINTINTKLDNIDVKVTSKEKDVDIEKELYLCPYCNSGLYVFASSGVGASSAQLKCHYCEFQTPKVYVNKSDSKLECIEKCRENFKNDTWTDEDIVGKPE